MCILTHLQTQFKQWMEETNGTWDLKEIKIEIKPMDMEQTVLRKIYKACKFFNMEAWKATIDRNLVDVDFDQEDTPPADAPSVPMKEELVPTSASVFDKSNTYMTIGYCLIFALTLFAHIDLHYTLFCQPSVKWLHISLMCTSWKVWCWLDDYLYSFWWGIQLDEISICLFALYLQFKRNLVKRSHA